MGVGSLGSKVGAKIKGFYYFFEDKWYNVLDKLDKHVPVYKVIDPIDKIIPSFVLFLLVILFLLILGGYLIRFASPYEVTFTTFDAVTKKALPTVTLSGTLDDIVFNELTNSNGQAILTAQGAGKNFFEVVWQLFFPTENYPVAVVNAQKIGYASISNQIIELDSTEYKLSLQPVGTEEEYPSSVTVVLVDAKTGSAIADNTSQAYVKFRCGNKTIAAKTVRDSADGEIDGSFGLNEPSCMFVLVSAFSPDYERINVSQDLASGTNRIELTRIATPTEGTAKVYVYEKGSSPKKYLGNIEVVLNGTSTTSVAITDASGVATKNLSPGTYSITITDENYYEINPDQNIKINIVKGETTELEVELQYKPATANRIIFFKVIDSTDNNVLAGVNVDLMWLKLDSNGNYYAASNGDIVDYVSGNPTSTDSNGFYKRAGFSDKTGLMVAVLSKAGYIYKVFKPALFTPGTGPETILMEKATASNSGSAKITVLASDTNKFVSGAQAFLYTDLTIGSQIIRKVKISRNGLITSSNGQVVYASLPRGTYAASAVFDEVFSGISLTKDLDVNQQISFEIKIQLNVAYLEIVPIDADTGVFVNSTVKLYVVNDSDFFDKTFSENLQYSFVGNQKYVSAGYAKKSRLLVLVDANTSVYAPNAIAIDGITRPLGPGANTYTVKMRKCVADANVDIFFAKEDVYALTDNPWSGTSTLAVLSRDNSYYAKFDAVLCKNTSYSELMALSVLEGPTKMTGLDFYEPYSRFADLYSADTNSMGDTILPHPDSYYLPTGAQYKADTNYKQSGIDWNAVNNVLPAGTYPFIVKFNINRDANEQSESLLFSFRAKEKHSTIASETPLKQVWLDLNRSLMSGVFFSVSVNAYPPILLSPNQISRPQSILMPEIQNTMQIKIQNNTPNALTNGTITVYSLEGATNSFVSGMAGNGRISFEALTSTKSKDIGTGVFAARYSPTQIYDTSMYPSMYNSSNYIVIEARFAQGTYKAFVDTKANAKTFKLDAEFLAGVPDQKFDGTIYPLAGDTDLTVKTVHLKALRKCNDTNVVYENDVPSSQINESSFYEAIPGVYAYHQDCLKLTITASSSDNGYAPYTATLYAGSGDSLDPTLACVEVVTSTGETESTLNWAQQEQFTVTNMCSKEVTVRVDVGLVCAASNGLACNADGQTLAAGASRTYTVTGKNVEYDPSVAKPNFTDVLGFYPLYVKAKFSDELNKKLSLVDKATIHLYNSNQCFAISQDAFDFVTSPSTKKDFFVSSDCQYLAIGNYYVPSVALNTFGYDLNYPVALSAAPVSFTPQLIVTGQQYTTTTTSSEKESTWSAIVKNADEVQSWNVLGENWQHYSLSYNLADINYPGDMTRAQFRWIDITNPFQGNNYPYGARIDGNILVKYANGSSYSFAPKTNFVIDPYPPTCDLARYSATEYCETGNDLGVGNIADQNFSFGLLYFLVNKGKVISIDLNIIGNKDANNLELRLWPFVNYTQTTQTVVPFGSTSTTSAIDVGPFSIYPLEGVTFILKNIDDISAFFDSSFTSTTNPTIYLASNNPQVLTWVESGYLKAKFIGYDISQFNDGTLDASIIKSFGQGIGYGIVTAVDYVSVETSQGKQISGAQ